MSFSDKPRKAREPREPGEPREPRTARRARPRQSLKMQAIGFLSRREYSRQELRARLLDSLRKRAREDAALAAATEAAARELAQALAEQPSNGIDDAFAPRTPEPARRPAHALLPARETHAGAPSASAVATREALATLTRGDGGALPSRLRSRLDAVVAESVAADAPRAASGSTADAHFDGDGMDDDAAAMPGRSDTPGATASDSLEHVDPEAAVEELLDWLVAQKYLNETRFVESRVNARSRKQGALRIKLELSRHGLTLEPEQAAALRETEFARAKALWERKFGALATDARERARQGRFLASRGFASDVVRRIVGGMDED